MGTLCLLLPFRTFHNSNNLLLTCRWCLPPSPAVPGAHGQAVCVCSDRPASLPEASPCSGWGTGTETARARTAPPTGRMEVASSLCIVRALRSLWNWEKNVRGYTQCEGCRLAQCQRTRLLTRETKVCPWVRKVPWRRARQPTQCSCPENPTDRGAWGATVHGVAKSRTRPSDFTFTFIAKKKKNHTTRKGCLLSYFPSLDQSTLLSFT